MPANISGPVPGSSSHFANRGEGGVGLANPPQVEDRVIFDDPECRLQGAIAEAIPASPSSSRSLVDLLLDESTGELELER